MKEKDKKKAEQLGMPSGTASNRLRKTIVFSLLKQLNQNFCFQCGEKIESEKELSIEHKIPYLDSEDPVKLFFDLDNIAFSHLSCNSRAARKNIVEHGANGYRRGCKCDICKTNKNQMQQRYRIKKKNLQTDS